VRPVGEVRPPRQSIAERALASALVEDRNLEALDGFAEIDEQRLERRHVHGAPLGRDDAVRPRPVDAEDHLVASAPRTAPGAEHELRLVAVAEGTRAPRDRLEPDRAESGLAVESGRERRLLSAELLGVADSGQRTSDAEREVRTGHHPSKATHRGVAQQPTHEPARSRRLVERLGTERGDPLC
jgi:hypothetical protein